MVDAFKQFMAGMGRYAIGWKVWLGALVLANFVVPIFFLAFTEAQITLVAGLCGMVIGVSVVKIQGFTRLIGLMHILWVPLVVYLCSSLSGYSANEPLGVWLRAVILLNTLSLVIDAIDVLRYLKGERQPLF